MGPLEEALYSEKPTVEISGGGDSGVCISLGVAYELLMKFGAKIMVEPANERWNEPPKEESWRDRAIKDPVFW